MWILFILTGAFTCDLSSQTFNKRYNVYSSNSGTGFSVEQDGSGNILVFFNANWQDTAYYYGSKMGVLRLTSEGVSLDTTMLPLPLNATYTGWSDASFKRADGSYVVGGGVQNVIDLIHRPAVYFFDAMGQPESLFRIV